LDPFPLERWALPCEEPEAELPFAPAVGVLSRPRVRGVDEERPPDREDDLELRADPLALERPEPLDPDRELLAEPWRDRLEVPAERELLVFPLDCARLEVPPERELLVLPLDCARERPRELPPLDEERLAFEDELGLLPDRFFCAREPDARCVAVAIGTSPRLSRREPINIEKRPA
jgi:hypothetical protein